MFLADVPLTHAAWMPAMRTAERHGPTFGGLEGGWHTHTPFPPLLLGERDGRHGCLTVRGPTKGVVLCRPGRLHAC